MKNQCGFVTIELIFIVIIISVLATLAVPSIARIVDTAYLDYEVKKFCSDFSFAHSLGRQGTFDSEIFSDLVIRPDDDSRGIVLSIDEDAGTYRILRSTTSEAVPIRDTHNLSDGVKIKVAKNSKIHFLPNGDIANSNKKSISESFTFTSRYNSFLISVDSVGRWRSKRNEN